MFVAPLKRDLAALKGSLAGEKVTRENLPADLVADWMTPDGRARVSIAPSADPNDNDAMRKFAKAVLAVEPDGDRGAGHHSGGDATRCSAPSSRPACWR